jgi:hypothetical protein
MQHPYVRKCFLIMVEQMNNYIIIITIIINPVELSEPLVRAQVLPEVHSWRTLM